ncbi:hypothetical protein Pyrde_1756 [Pyrodictium delaneyi]|uniref:Uncharacterized protein n=1 Tax=Pyrodictium delaneyi TaxID=1273541 RepID=A0A0P0N578_9CREN|nr:hypothetical protein Pyrde_1756 [Pyrodictium delaneyi]
MKLAVSRNQRCPVCGRNGTIKLRLGRITVYVCSQEHAELVARNPARYIQRLPEPIVLLEQHVCPDTEYDEDEDIMVYRVGC